MICQVLQHVLLQPTRSSLIYIEVDQMRLFLPAGLFKGQFAQLGKHCQKPLGRIHLNTFLRSSPAFAGGHWVILWDDPVTPIPYSRVIINRPMPT